jgi:hypothetical protein
MDERNDYNSIPKQPIIKNKAIKLTASEINHIIELMYLNKNQGEYYGNREQYWKRHQRILDKIDNQNK